MSIPVPNTGRTHGSGQPRLLFLSLDWARPKDMRIPLSTASIEAYFMKNRAENIKAEFQSFNLCDESFSISTVKELIAARRPDFLALGAYIWNEEYVPDVVTWSKARFPNAAVILGGPQITYGNQNLVIEYPGADYFIKGDGELPFTKLINALSSGEILTQNLLDDYAIYTPDTLRQGQGTRIYTTDLNQLSSPYLSGVMPIEKGQPFVRWETLRRCPYRCNFCQFRMEGGRVDYISLERIFQELELFKENDVQEIAVLDPIFNLNPKHYMGVCKKIADLEMQSQFYFQCRLELLCKPSGVEFLRFCQKHNVLLEFGVQTFVDDESDASDRNNDYSKIDQAIKMLHEFGVPFDLHLIFGLPFQSFDSFRQSYDRARDARPTGIYIFPLNVLKGTKLDQKHRGWGYELDPGANNALLKSQWMTEEEVRYLEEFSKGVNRHSKAVRGTEYATQYPDLGHKGLLP